MVDFKTNNREKEVGKIEGKEAPERKEKIEKKEVKEIKKAKEEAIEEISAVVEGVEIPEISEFVEGRVSEKVGGGKKVAPGGVAAAGGTAAFDLSKIEIPTVEVMREQISFKINAEIKKLEKEVKRIKKGPNFSPFDLNLVVTKIRYLQDLLAKVAHATAETLKGLWLKYVKGISA